MLVEEAIEILKTKNPKAILYILGQGLTENTLDAEDIKIETLEDYHEKRYMNDEEVEEMLQKRNYNKDDIVIY